jgi:hypothetical protein
LTGVGAGGPACNANGIPLYQLHIPVAGSAISVFYDWKNPTVPLEPEGEIPVLQGNHISLDLYNIQPYSITIDK